MKRKQKGVKISLHDLGRALGGEPYSSNLPSRSSIREGHNADSMDWYRKERVEVSRPENHRTRNQNEGSNEFWRMEEVDEQQNWRSGENKTDDTTLKRSSRTTTSTIQPSSLLSRNIRDQTLFRRKDADVDFSLAREGPRRAAGSCSNMDQSKYSRLRPSSSFRSIQDKKSNDDLECWRQQPVSHTSSSMKLNDGSHDSVLKKNSSPLRHQGVSALQSRTIDDTKSLKIADGEIPQSSGGLPTTHSALCGGDPFPDSLSELTNGLSQQQKTKEEQMETSTNDANNNTNTSSCMKSKILDTGSTAGSTQEDTNLGGSSGRGNTTLPFNTPEAAVKSVSKQVSCDTPLSKLLSTSPSLEKSTPPCVEKDVSKTVESTIKDRKTSDVWRPSHLRQNVINTTATDKDQDICKKIEDFVKTKGLDHGKTSNQKTPTGLDHSAEKTDATKEMYKKVLLEKEKKKKEEEARKRLAKIESERLEKMALERLMYGDCRTSEELENAMENGIRQEDANGLLTSFTKLLTPEDITSLVPSILIVKCLIRKSLGKEQFRFMARVLNNNTNSVFWFNLKRSRVKSGVSCPINEKKRIVTTGSSCSQVTDLQRMEKVSGLVRLFKPVLTYIFNHSGIKRHKLRFLWEIQRFINEMKFPRVSSGLSLIEAIWDSLYMEDVIEEQYFIWWYEDTLDDTPGRSNVLFQMLGWFNWIKSAAVDGQEVESDSESCPTEDSDID